jgi:hypothetical protein
MGMSTWKAHCFPSIDWSPINKGSTQYYITQALHPSSGGTNKPVLLTVLGLARDKTVLIFPLPEMTKCDMLLLAVTIQMGHDIRNSLKG